MKLFGSIVCTGSEELRKLNKYMPQGSLKVFEIRTALDEDLDTYMLGTLSP